MIPVPDILHLTPQITLDGDRIDHLLSLAFTGRDMELAFDNALAETEENSPWQAEFFAKDLFISELVQKLFRLTIDGQDYSVNHVFLERTLCHPPNNLDEIHFRQQIVAELVEKRTLRRRAEKLYQNLYDLLNMFRVPGRQARMHLSTFRIDLLRLAKKVIDQMADDFSTAESGLLRLHETALEIRASSEYQLITTLLDFVERTATLNVNVNVGPTGKITNLQICEVRENRKNPFYRPPWTRWLHKLRFLLWHGYRLEDEQIVGRLVEGIFERLAPSLRGLTQLLGHLEFYLTNIAMLNRAKQQQLQLCLPTFDSETPREFKALFNPLLLTHKKPPVPLRHFRSAHSCVTLITGPNSGGKTRLLQAQGLTQVLGQSGLFVPAAEANLWTVSGLYVSLIENEAVEHAEGRLGRELERIRSMFDVMQPGSMVILDELCSGTNPSEATEVFSMVLRLLETLSPVAFITTHFLDFAHQLAKEPPIAGLEFLQVEINRLQSSTYQFVPGVATSSLAAVMAERMGVTFGELSAAIAARKLPDSEAEVPS